MSEPVLLEAGAVAPEIDAVATGGEAFRLSDHSGKWVVIYFYPRANTPG
ncbi:MAG: redoxin domain-containing protein [Coriobacteriia bacterium]|nr:redoxin domain-containing protein [Coriobacteriia bacterium]